MNQPTQPPALMVTQPPKPQKVTEMKTLCYKKWPDSCLYNFFENGRLKVGWVIRYILGPFTRPWGHKLKE